MSKISASGRPTATASDGTPRPAGRDPLAWALRRNLVQRCGFTGGGVVVAVSGGGDSMALMHLLAALGGRRRGLGREGTLGPIIVAHIDHGLRRESAAEGDLVAASAAAIGLCCERRRVDCGDPPGVAARARRERYFALAAIARGAGANAVITAHHADDQFESLLIALGRGRSAAVMRWSRTLGEGVRLLRPLLDVPRRSLREFGDRLGIPRCEDPGNGDPRTLRGRIRTAIAPAFESLWPGSPHRSATVAEDAALGAMAIERWLEETFGPSGVQAWSRARLGDLPAPLLAAGLRRALHAADSAAAQRLPRRSLDAAAMAMGQPGRRPRTWRWPCGWELRIDAREVRLTQRR